MSGPAYISDPALLAELNGPPPPPAASAGYVSDPALLSQLNGEAETPEAPGVLESAALGAGQGLSFGFGDEIYGAAKFLASGGRKGSYTAARDAARERIHAAEEAHPIASTVGTVAGGFLMPGGVLKGGATLGAKALAGAGMGALGGLGNSEGKDVGEIGGDVLRSAAVGGVLFPVVSTVASKVIAGAPERAVKRIVGDITDGATATKRDRLIGGLVREGGEAAEGAVAKVGAGEALPTSGRRGVDAVLDIMGREPALKKALKSAADEPTKALRVVQDTIEAKGGRLGEIYGELDSVALGAPLKGVLGALENVAAQYKSPAEKAIRRQIERLAADIQEDWGASRYVPLRDLRQTISSIQARGFAGSPTADISIVKQMQRDTAGALKGVLDKRFDEIAETAANIRQSPSLFSGLPAQAGKGRGTDFGEQLRDYLAKTDGVGEIRQLNKDFSTLKNLEGVLEYRATREASPSTTLRARGNNLLDMGLLATGNLPAFAAKKSYELVGKHIARFGDDKLAQLVMRARGGSTQAQLATAAMELGLGNAALAPLLARWAGNAAQQSVGGEQ